MCLFICSCSYQDNREDYNFLENNSIRFIKNDTGIILLINKNDIFYKVILNDIDDIYYDYVIDINKTRYFCNNDIIYRRDDKIEIMMNNKRLCIYIDRYKDSDYRDCNFIYLYDSIRFSLEGFSIIAVSINLIASSSPLSASSIYLL